MPAGEVAVGETVVVRPGERLAVDGEVIEGRTTVDESPVTGESPRWRKARGLGLLGKPQRLRRAARPGDLREAGDSTLQRIVRLVEEAQAKKAPAEQFVDRFSRVYTPVVVAVAVVLAVVPPLLGFDFGGVVLQGARPPDHRLPLRAGDFHARHRGLRDRARLAEGGILIKGGAALEAAGRLKALAFDKTGTLTEGRPVLSRVVSLDGRGRGRGALARGRP